MSTTLDDSIKATVDLNTDTLDDEDVPSTPSPITHYQLDNGAIWDLAQASFLANTYDTYIPEENLGRLVDDNGYATITALRDYLVSNGLPLGVLEPADQITRNFYALRDTYIAECLEQFKTINWQTLSDTARERWKYYYRALKHLPEQEGFPWDGLDNTPWPEHP